MTNFFAEGIIHGIFGFPCRKFCAGKSGGCRRWRHERESECVKRNPVKPGLFSIRKRIGNPSGLAARSGSAVIFVMAIVFAASIVSVYLVEYSMREMKPRASAVYECDLRSEAYGALNAAIAVLAEYSEIDGGIYSPLQGWEEPLADGRLQGENSGDVIVKISDESGKIPLRNLDTTKLASLLEEIGLTSRDAEECADCIMDWTDSDDAALLSGAEYDDYDRYEAFPPNRPLKSLSELAYVKKARDVFFDENGFPNELFKKLGRIVSVEDFSTINLNSASPEVLEILMEMEDKTYSDDLYLAIRGKIGSITDGIRWIKQKEDITNRGGGEYPATMTNCKSTLLKIEVTVRRGIGEYYLCAYYGSQQENKRSSGKSGGSSSGGSSSGGNKSQSSGGGHKASGESGSGAASSQSSASSNKNSRGTQMKVLKLFERGA